MPTVTNYLRTEVLTVAFYNRAGLKAIKVQTLSTKAQRHANAIAGHAADIAREAAYEHMRANVAQLIHRTTGNRPASNIAVEFEPVSNDNDQRGLQYVYTVSITWSVQA